MPSINSRSDMMRYVKYILPAVILFTLFLAVQVKALPSGTTVVLEKPNNTAPTYLTIRDMAVDSSGYIYGALRINYDWPSNEYGFVKLNPDGTVAWSYALGQIAGSTTEVLAVTTNGTHVWFGGQYYDSAKGYRMNFIICFKSDGTVVWANKYGGFVGNYLNDLLYDNGVLIAVGSLTSSYNPFIVKLNPNTGAVISGVYIASHSFLDIYRGRVFKLGNYYILHGTRSSTPRTILILPFDSSLNLYKPSTVGKSGVDVADGDDLGPTINSAGGNAGGANFIVGTNGNGYGVIVSLNSSGYPQTVYEVGYAPYTVIKDVFCDASYCYFSGEANTNPIKAFVFRTALTPDKIHWAYTVPFGYGVTNIEPYVHSEEGQFSGVHGIGFTPFSPSGGFSGAYTNETANMALISGTGYTFTAISPTVGAISPTVTAFTPTLKKVIWSYGYYGDPPSIAVSDQTAIYNYNGVQVSAVVNKATHYYFYYQANDSITSFSAVNTTAKTIYKTYKLPAGTYTITVYAKNTSYSVGGQTAQASRQFKLTINKATPSLSLSLPSSVRWMDGFTITASENNMGDNDVAYKVYLGNTYLGGVGSYFQKVASGIYTVKFIAIGGQNYTGNEISKQITVLKAWEKTDSIDANKSYYYDLNALAVPVEAYQSDTPANNTIVAGSPLYILSSAVVKNTNGNTGLQDTFTNIYVNISIPSGFKNLSSARKLVSSLAYNQQTTTSLYSKAVTVYEKSHSCSTGSCTYTLTVNESKYTPQLPIKYVLPDPPNWASRTSYTITVDGKSTGFTFYPDNLTLVISTSFSQSSLEPGDHVISLTYTLPTGGAPSPTPSQNVSTGGAPPSPQNVSIGGGFFAGGAISFFGILIPLHSLLLLLLLLAVLIFMLAVVKKKKRRVPYIR